MVNTPAHRALVRYTLAATVVTVALAWALFLARDALLLIYIAAVVAIGLSPLVTAAEQRSARARYHLPRWAAILAIYVCILGILVGVGLLLIPPLVSQAQALWTAFPSIVQQGQQWLIDRGVMPRAISVGEAIRQTPVAGTNAVTTVLGAVWGFIGGIFGAITILILSFYMLANSRDIVRAFVRLFPRTERARVQDACHRVTTKVSAWLNGQLLLAGIIGTTAAIGLGLMGVPYFYVLALIAGIGEMIPVVGPLLAAIPAIAVALSVSPATALFVTIFFVVQQQFENHVLVPKVMERQVGVTAVVVIVALIIGGSLLGIVGAILAVPTAAVLQVLLQELTAEPSAN